MSFARVAIPWTLFAAIVVACGDSTPPSDSAAIAGQAGSPDLGGTLIPIAFVAPDDGLYKALAASDSPLIESATPTTLEYTPAVPSLSFPIPAAQIGNLADIEKAALFSWSSNAREALTARGLIALRTRRGDEDFAAAYFAIKQYDLPILVTADSTLHLYHLFFNQLLKNTELRRLIPLFQAMLPKLRDQLAAMVVAQNGAVKEAARRALAFITVAEALLSPGNFVLYDVVKEEVEKEWKQIHAQDSFYLDPILSQDCLDREVGCTGSDLPDEEYLAGKGCYCEDYTQYKPRGHYTQSADLERYFQAAMFLGRFPLRIKSPLETRMAVVLTAALAKTSVALQSGQVSAAELWSRIYRVSSFFAGNSDDLTFVDYDRVIREIYGESFALSALTDDAKLTELRSRLAEERKPKVLSAFVQSYLDTTKQTQGLRFLGQRFAFDSYVLGQLVFKNVGPSPQQPGFPAAVPGSADCQTTGLVAPVGCDAIDKELWAPICCAALGNGDPEVCRLLPKGLDVAAALGSSRARDLLIENGSTDYCAYSSTLDSLQSEAAAWPPQDWWQNLYTGWLHLLQPTFEPNTTGFPSWMTGSWYRDKSLNTGLASWAELRHDTILYTKQSYTSGLGGTGGAAPYMPKENAYFVEPLPEVYTRLSDLVSFTQTGLSTLELLPVDAEKALVEARGLFDQLTSISIHELEDKALTLQERMVVDQIDHKMWSILANLSAADPTKDYTLESSEGLQTSVVVDVHTDPNTKSVLEVGSGRIDWIVVVNRLPEGKLAATVGPLFTYYEFPHNMADRLTDEQWRGMLKTGTAPPRPAWIEALYPPP